MSTYFTMRFLRLLVLLGELLYEPKDCPIPDAWLLARFGGMEFKLKLGDEIVMKYTVADDHQDEPFSLDPITGGTDAEGNEIPATDFSLTDPVSSDESIVSILVDDAGAKSLHWGAPGAALVQTQPMYRGTAFGAPITAEFVVTTGTPVSSTGGGINIPGLTPDPAVA